jgi:hypothetical protein
MKKDFAYIITISLLAVGLITSVQHQMAKDREIAGLQGQINYLTVQIDVLGSYIGNTTTAVVAPKDKPTAYLLYNTTIFACNDCGGRYVPVTQDGTIVGVEGSNGCLPSNSFIMTTGSDLNCTTTWHSIQCAGTGCPKEPK